MKIKVYMDTGTVDSEISDIISLDKLRVSEQEWRSLTNNMKLSYVAQYWREMDLPNIRFTEIND